MSEDLKALMCGYEKKYPQQLVERFPRIVEKIVSLWNSPEAFSLYMQELLVADRHDRQGFPAAIASELFSLNSVYDEIQQVKDQSDDIWGVEVEEAKAELERLGISINQQSLFSASERKDREALTLLLKAGLSPDVRDEKHWTPLMVASFEGNEEIAFLLIQHGASITAQDKGGYSPLHWASLGGYERVVKLLLEKGADVNARTQYGITPLLQAAARGHTTVVKALLMAGGRANEPSDEGWTALHKAVANGHAEVVKALLDHGGDLLVPSRDGATPFVLAQKSQHPEIRATIRQWVNERAANRSPVKVYGSVNNVVSGEMASVFSRPAVAR